MNVVDEELVFVHNKNKNEYQVFGKNGFSFMFRNWIVSRKFGCLGIIKYDEATNEWYFEKSTIFVGAVSFSQDTFKQIHDVLEQLNKSEDLLC